MPEILLCEEHSQVYETWRERQQTGLTVTHIDFHCDMRGFLIDRRRGLISLLDSFASPGKDVDSGNYLGHAALEGIAPKVRWIHDVHGGRRYDAGTVKYTTDLSIRAKKLLGRIPQGAEAPIDFDVLTFDQWDGDISGHQLDIDWDGLASIDYDRSYARRVTEEFLAREFAVPETTFVAYSPGYSDPDRSLYEAFVERLADKFSADVKRLPPPNLRPGFPKPPQDLGLTERLKHRLAIALHGIGIY
jgi:hypothetical protein